MDYNVNINGENVSSTLNTENKKTSKWSLEKIYDSQFTVESLIETLQVIDTFKRKYPNDDTIQSFEDIVRDEICQIFGGTTIDVD